MTDEFKTRIVLINQFFRPDLAPTGQLLADLAERLNSEGAEVTVISSDTSYAAGGDARLEGVTVIRVRASAFSRLPLFRAFSYLSFFISALLCALRLPRFDAVVTMTTPPFLPLIGTLLKRLRGVRHTVWVMDLYPEVAIALGQMRPASLLTSLLKSSCGLALRNADAVIALGDCMRDRLIQSGAAPTNIHVVHNWADSTAIFPLPYSLSESLHVLYAGNLGLAHEVDTILGAIEQLRGDTRFRFTFSGGGARRKHIEMRCRANVCDNVAFLPYHDAAELNHQLALGDVGLITQMPETGGLIVPSKLYSLMAAGRPVIFIGPRDSVVTQVIEKFGCGWQVDCGDIAELVSLLKQLHREPQTVRDAGNRGRLCLINNFDLPIGVGRISGIVRDVASSPATSTPADESLMPVGRSGRA